MNFYLKKHLKTKDPPHPLTNMSTVHFAKEFIAFMEHFRINTFGYPSADMRDWANECQAIAKAEGYTPIIQYYEDPYDYCNQIKLFIPLLTGESLISNKSALEFVTEIFLQSGNELGDTSTTEFYTYLCKTSQKLDTVYRNLISRFINIDRSLSCIEDHLWSDCGTVPYLIRVIRSIRPNLFEETFRNVKVLTEDERESVYDLSPSEITEDQLLAILRYDVMNAMNDD